MKADLVLRPVVLELPVGWRSDNKMHRPVSKEVHLSAVAVDYGVMALQGALDDLMQEVADMYQRDVEYEIKTLGAQIEPILIVFLGVMVLILALGIFLPIWDLGKVALHKG